MPSGDVFVAEDGGNLKLCILANTNGVDQVARFLRFIGHDASEVTGPAFSPDHTRLYVSSQRGSDGIYTYIYEITRHGLHENRLWVAVGGRSIKERRRSPQKSLFQIAVCRNGGRSIRSGEGLPEKVPVGLVECNAIRAVAFSYRKLRKYLVVKERIGLAGAGIRALIRTTGVTGALEIGQLELPGMKPGRSNRNFRRQRISKLA